MVSLVLSGLLLMASVSPVCLSRVYDLWSREAEQKHVKIANEGVGRSTDKKM